MIALHSSHAPALRDAERHWRHSHGEYGNDDAGIYFVRVIQVGILNSNLLFRHYLEIGFGVDKADSVLMDLRSYTSKREGCSHELNVLATQPHLHKLVILFDKNTEKPTAETLLAASTTKIVWIDSQTNARKLQEQVLGTLLGS